METAEGGDVLFVAESAAQRATWLSALREVVGAAAVEVGQGEGSAQTRRRER